jgi:hypothetical protein
MLLAVEYVIAERKSELQIVGYADRSETILFNKWLPKRRAQYIAREIANNLTKHELRAEIIVSVAGAVGTRGVIDPRNRRVDIIVS